MKDILSTVPSLVGKVAIITGGTAGLGLCSAIELASKGAHVIIGARSETRAQEAIVKIKAAIRDKNANTTNTIEPIIEFGITDHEDLRSIVAFADWFLAKQLPLHILMCNAGVAATPFKLIEGIESQLFINHVAHQCLIERLLPVIISSAPSRIVLISSDAHRWVNNVIVEPAPTEKTYNGMQAYGASKGANLLYARYMTRFLIRQKHQNVYINSVHPGPVATEISKKAEMSDWMRAIYKFVERCFFKTPEDAVLTQVYVAASSEIAEKGVKGAYYVPVAKQTSTKAYVRVDGADEALYKWTKTKIEQILAK